MNANHIAPIFRVRRSSCKNLGSLCAFIVVCLRLNLILFLERTQSRAPGVTGSGRQEKSLLLERSSGVISVPSPSTDGGRVCVLLACPRSPPGQLICGTVPSGELLPCLPGVGLLVVPSLCLSSLRGAPWPFCPPPGSRGRP